MGCDATQRVVKNWAAHVIEKDVDAFGAQLFQPRLDRIVLVVDGVVVAHLINQPSTFLRTASNTNGGTTHELTKLTNDRTHRARRTGHQKHVTRFWPTRFQQPKIGR